MVERGDDAAGLLEVGEFEGDRGANDGFLPIVGDGKPAYPCRRVVARAIGEFAARGGNIGEERLVGPSTMWIGLVRTKGASRSI